MLQASRNPYPAAPHKALTYPHKIPRVPSNWIHWPSAQVPSSNWIHWLSAQDFPAVVTLLELQATGQSNNPHKSSQATGRSNNPHKIFSIPSNWTMAKSKQDSPRHRKPYSSNTSSVKKDKESHPKDDLAFAIQRVLPTHPIYRGPNPTHIEVQICFPQGSKALHTSQRTCAFALGCELRPSSNWTHC